MNLKTTPPRDLIERIARDIPTPFHLYDEARLIENARALKAAFSWNPGYREYFAVKATPNPYLLELFKREGCGVDCASETELTLARAVGFSGEQIMFSSNQTPAREYELARAMGATINLDDSDHIDFLARHGGIPERICLRYNPGGEIRVGNHVMGRPVESKFGMTREQVFLAVERLMALGVKSFGLHAFLASNALDDDYYPGIARMLMELAQELYARLGARVMLINLSGGVGVAYHPDDTPPDILAIGARVKAAYDELIRFTALDPMDIATELGRYMTGSAGYLVATAIHLKNTYKHYIGLDATACDLMRPAMYGAYHHITVLGKEHLAGYYQYDVVGSLCENNDKFAVDRLLPKVEVGDLLVLHDTGAHGHSMGYNYNGKLRSAEVLLHEDHTYTRIRRAETPADYFATLNYPGL